MADASQSYAAKLAFEPGASPHTFDTSSEPIEFISESLARNGAILDTNALRGTRSHHAAVTRAGNNTIGGTIAWNPSPLDLDTLLPRILGTAESSDSFVLADVLLPFGVIIDRVAKRFLYADCYINKATFKGSAGGLVEVSIDVVAKTETTSDTAFPAIVPSAAANGAPYTFMEGVLTTGGGAKDMMDFELVIDNQIDVRFTNSINATSITPKDRIVTLTTTNPYTSSEAALYAQATAGATGSLVFTNGGMSTTFTFATLQVPPVSPTASARGEIPLKLVMTARMTGTTRELAVTHDSTA